LLDLLIVDDDDLNYSVFMTCFESAKERISPTKKGEWREVIMPTAQIIQECSLVIERYIDDTFCLLAKVTVL
jgi:hypothetical protein